MNGPGDCNAATRNAGDKSVDNLETNRPHVLVVDDEPDMVALLQDVLRRAGFEVDGAQCGEEARRAMASRDYALMLLDLRLKTEDGLTLAREMRQASAIPIIMISGSSDETDRVLLLELAADDFLIKPFSPRELVARVRAVLRRYDKSPQAAPTPPAHAAARAGNERLRFGGWTLDLTERELHRVDGSLCALTQTEFRLLEAFVRQPRRIWTRDQLLEQTRSFDADVFDRTIDVLILRLRRKIEPNPKHPSYICTERGMGYLFSAEVTRS